MYIECCLLARVSTGSTITFILPKMMHIEDCYLWLHDNMHGWEFVVGDCDINLSTPLEEHHDSTEAE